MIHFSDTICAPAAAAGGALAIIRLSGEKAISIAQSIFSGKIAHAPSHTIAFGTISDGEEIIDEALVSIFRDGKSFSGEEMAEISCHGSSYIVGRILQLLVERGARLAQAGEFSKRAFLNGKIDLAQAEAVADMIAASSKAQHAIAMRQLRGDLSRRLQTLRLALLDFASLLELEIDFSEEDVEFARREELLLAIRESSCFIRELMDSFSAGNAIKEGVRVVIAGAPNVGKSTLFNALIEEEKAIVSPIAGTTRDTIEDMMNIEGVLFRFLDTAGLRDTDDAIEKIGVERARKNIVSANVVIHVSDAGAPLDEAPYLRLMETVPEQRVLFVVNKMDEHPTLPLPEGHIGISAIKSAGIEELKKRLVAPYLLKSETHHFVIANARHYSALSAAYGELSFAEEGIAGGRLTSDMLAWHIRQALLHIGEITGEVYADDILGNIFKKFCIGK